MATGCGQRCQFCLPDLNPQIDVSKDQIMFIPCQRARRQQPISLATEDMFIWGQVHTDTPFYFPNREALLDLYSTIVNTPGVEHHVFSHSTIAPAVVDPLLIEKLTELCLDKSPIKIPLRSTHPEKRAIVPLIGLETASVRMAKQIMPSKGVPFPIDDWPSVFLRGLEILNKHNWFPAVTLIIGNPGKPTRTPRRRSISSTKSNAAASSRSSSRPSSRRSTTRAWKKEGVTETARLTPLQWRLMMKCWKMNLRPGQMSWGPMVWRLGRSAWA
jgi:radical SAM superfamily enzyme YgiQ (UPF0313 family)